MTWLLTATFDDDAALQRALHVSGKGTAVLHASAALPLEPGDAVVLEVTLATYGFKRWANGVVRARGTGGLTLDFADARVLLHKQRKLTVLARRSPRFWAGLDLQVDFPDRPPVRGQLLEVSAEGGRVAVEFGAAGRVVDVSLPLDGAALPLGRARICWRTSRQAGLAWVDGPVGPVPVARLMRQLSTRWQEALPLLPPGGELPRVLPQPPLPLAEALASDLRPPERPQAEQGPEEQGGLLRMISRLVSSA
jgi:hypothetical protein